MNDDFIIKNAIMLLEMRLEIFLKNEIELPHEYAAMVLTTPGIIDILEDALHCGPPYRDSALELAKAIASTNKKLWEI